MAKTTNYELEKPAVTDYYDIGVFNSNADIIDTKIKAAADAAAGAQSAASAAQGTANTHATRHKTGGADELTPADISAAPAATELTGTLNKDNWTGSAAPYTQAVSIAGIKATTKGVVGLPENATATQREEARAAMMHLTAVAANSVTITADGTKPENNIPIKVLVVG
ncbi:MAG TPA: hypothetical protein PKX46_00010 [Clostridia bacterium]|nr:hypothetical protein [Clostridia bacterium]